MSASAPHRAAFLHPARSVAQLHVEPGEMIADLGAGSGHYTLACAKALAGSGKVYAIDVHEDMLRRIKNEAAHQGLKNVETIHGDIERAHGTKLSDRSMDLILMSNVLFQLQEPQEAFREAWRILRPSGTLALFDWSESFGGMGPAKEHVIIKSRAIELAGQGGFALAGEMPAGAHHYGLLFKPLLTRT